MSFEEFRKQKKNHEGTTTHQEVSTTNTTRGGIFMTICNRCKKNKWGLFMETCEVRGCEISECKSCRGLVLKQKSDTYLCSQHYADYEENEETEEEDSEEEVDDFQKNVELALTLTEAQMKKAHFLMDLYRFDEEYTANSLYGLLKKAKGENQNGK